MGIEGLSTAGKIDHLITGVDSQDVAANWVARVVLKGHIFEADKWSPGQEILRHVWNSELQYHIQNTGKWNNSSNFSLQIFERIFVSSKVNEILRKLRLLVCFHTDENCKYFYVIRIMHFLIINILCNKQALWNTIYDIRQLLHVSAPRFHPQGVIKTKVYKSKNY
jgi:hypothetical protein